MFEMTPATSENQCTRLKKGYKLKYTFATAHSRNTALIKALLRGSIHALTQEWIVNTWNLKAIWEVLSIS